MAFGTKLSPDPYDHLTPGDLREKHGKQKGDPIKAVKAVGPLLVREAGRVLTPPHLQMYLLAGMPKPPLRILLGSEAYEAMLKKLESCKPRTSEWARQISELTPFGIWTDTEQVTSYKAISCGCDFEETLAKL